MRHRIDGKLSREMSVPRTGYTHNSSGAARIQPRYHEHILHHSSCCESVPAVDSSNQLVKIRGRVKNTPTHDKERSTLGPFQAPCLLASLQCTRHGSGHSNRHVSRRTNRRTCTTLSSHKGWTILPCNSSRREALIGLARVETCPSEV